ncbi:site-specific integrase [Marinobacter salinexigens]|uniref:Site-specific integrase n=1 Tax=Marinobacter salinexigens TaxID=2919747 RepID=A0A5B0VNC6_9GAMM|nr:site-specific integrase [Marinobacter salinexigens]KAA1175878.1 site-specific integrase [Marinobacter salinexigens]
MASIEKRTDKQGKSSYRVKIRLKGRPTETATFDRLTDAKRWATQTEAAIREGRHFHSAAGKGKTLSDAIERYERDILPGLKDQKHRSTHLAWWKKKIGETAIKDVNSALLTECKDELRTTPYKTGNTYKQRSDATVNRYIASLSPVMKAATNDWEWIPNNPCQKVRRGSETKGRTRFLAKDERNALLDACDKATETPELKIIVLLALTTGGRRGEISGLRWQDVDLQRKRVTFEDTKNGETRAAPLVGPALAAMTDWAKVRPLNGSAYVFAGRTDKTKSKPLDFEKAWQTALKRAELTDFRFHDLRHTAASYLAMNGAGLRELADILGHKTLAMVQRYSHLTQDHKAAVVERMTSAIFGAIE